MRFNNKYEDILGITKCLRIGAKNFIVHFKTRGDEEWFSEKRDDVIKTIADRFKNSEGKGIHIYGVSTLNLSDYITSDKDILRKICKMPS